MPFACITSPLSRRNVSQTTGWSVPEKFSNSFHFQIFVATPTTSFQKVAITFKQTVHIYMSLPDFNRVWLGLLHFGPRCENTPNQAKHGVPFGLALKTRRLPLQFAFLNAKFCQQFFPLLHVDDCKSFPPVTIFSSHSVSPSALKKLCNYRWNKAFCPKIWWN